MKVEIIEKRLAKAMTKPVGLKPVLIATIGLLRRQKSISSIRRKKKDSAKILYRIGKRLNTIKKVKVDKARYRCRGENIRRLTIREELKGVNPHIHAHLRY